MYVRYRSQLDHLFQLLEKGAADLQVRKRIFRAPAILYGKIEHVPRQARDKQHRERALKKEMMITLSSRSPVNTSGCSSSSEQSGKSRPWVSEEN
jgi:hypothetical protein